MSILNQILDELKQSMKDRDTEKLGLLRQVKAAMQNDMIEKGVDMLEDNDVITLLKREVKRRKESIAEYKKADRNDLAETEHKELGFLQAYLPAQLSDDDIRSHIETFLSGKSDVTMADFGTIMSGIMEEIGDKVDGSSVSRILKELLSK